jgi:SOS response regulatory protein OraA/RecX
VALFNKPNDLPVDQVKALRQRGFDNNQIVQSLQRNGYSSSQIFDALNQADLKSGGPSGVRPSTPKPSPMDQNDGALPPRPEFQNNPSQPPMTMPSNDNVEEMVESIVNEKWQDSEKKLKEISQWQKDTEDSISRLDEKLNGLKEEFDKLHQAVIGKIGEYDKNILSVGAEIKAMEKVFSKVLPVFTENVGELSRITEKLKK